MTHEEILLEAIEQSQAQARNALAAGDARLATQWIDAVDDLWEQLDALRELGMEGEAGEIPTPADILSELV